MSMDWLAALGTQDQSMEAALAKRDLSKKMNLALSIAKEAEGRREFGQEQQFRNRQLDETSRLREATMDQTRQYREQAEADRKATERRLRYNTLHDNLKPGDRVTDPDAQALLKEYGTGEQLTPAEDDPTAQIYQKHAFEVAELKRKQEEELKKAAEARAKEDQQMQREAAKRAEKAAADLQKSRDLARKATEQRLKDADTKAAELSPVGAREAAQAAKARLDSMDKDPAFLSGKTEEDIAAARANAVHEEFSKVHEREQKAKGGPAKPSDLAKPPAAAGDFLSPDEVKRLFPNLPPGSKVQRVK